ncbi:hypothetical protein H012_gp747 [Acanthamoeba polyphaga moumouvirus]|uniref:Uncharacterized protein n=1 Tax=Acanthamoeba polyphaga moumouvirus TaxID=1269028 RepID=L7RCK2_9VIRU|nr:hypothetical protein H012_gp747 [Acanthamoeba polyphaga moumouvirus]AGC01718.1 hypothetical protein Moumou_00174 [Acanthamoeba polyphaga moumouvirus]
MKKYIFKFVDHERRTVTKISINVFVNKRNEDHPNPDDLDAHIAHAIQHVKRNHVLKRELIRIVGERYFNNATSTNGRFGEYILKKHHHKKESDLVNISNEAAQPRFKKVKQFEMHKVKFTRGRKPTEINQIFDYTKTHYVHDFAITNESDQAVQLAELASFTVPINNETRSTTANTSVTRNQEAVPGTLNATGGEDDPFMSVRQSYAANRGRMNTNNRDYSSGNNNNSGFGSGSNSRSNNNNSTNTGSRSTANANRNANTMSGNTSGNTSLYTGNNNNNRTTLNASSANASWNNIAASNRGSMANTSALNNNNNNNQMGGENDDIYKDKYEKYKKKYLGLKNQGLSNF